MPKFAVVFESSVYKTVYISADDADHAQEKAFDYHFPEVFISTPGVEINDSGWFVDSIQRVDEND